MFTKYQFIDSLCCAEIAGGAIEIFEKFENHVISEKGTTDAKEFVIASRSFAYRKSSRQTT